MDIIIELLKSCFALFCRKNY